MISYVRAAFVTVAATILTLACGRTAHVDEVRAGQLVISDAIAPAPLLGARPDDATMAVYFRITNEGAVTDTLVGSSSAAATMAMVHATEDRGGMSSMMATPSLVVPAATTVRLAPGGMHVMLEQLRHPIAAGDRVPLDLVFRRAGPVRITVLVVRYAQLDSIFAERAAEGRSR